MAEVSQAVARFAVEMTYGDLDRRAVAMASDAISDAVACGLAGSREEIAGVLLSTIVTATVATDGLDSVLLGSQRTAGPLDAALYNGTVIHALDYDDTAHPSYSHPSSHLVPVLLALSRRHGLTGRDLVAAYVAGLEVEGRLGRALNMRHYLRGWHTTGTFGAVAAAVTAGRLLGLSVDRMVTALGIAASSAGGLRANFGTMVKPLHAGLAAAHGLRAGVLAANGFSASKDAFDGRYGFLDVYGEGEPDDGVWRDLGRRWEILTDHGLALKPFPSCGATHPAIEAAIKLGGEVGNDRIESVRVGVNSFTHDILIYPRPTSPLEAKFSMEYCVAAALIRRRVDLSTFTPEQVADPAVQSLLPRIRVEVDERVRDNSEFGAVVDVTTGAGRQLSHTVLLAEGKPARWLSEERLQMKFLDCAGPVLGHRLAREAFSRLRTLTGENVAAATVFDPLLAPKDGAA